LVIRGFVVRLLVAPLVLWCAFTAAAVFALPSLLLRAPLPERSDAGRAEVRAKLAGPGERWTVHAVRGAQGHPLEVWWLHRAAPHGVAIILHGFGDDAWGSAPVANDLPELDAVVFTFRGRDRHPEVPSTLGAWERADVASVVRFLQTQSVARSRMLFSALSQGAGVALLAMADLEPHGGTFGGALLESPYQDLADAARNHLRGTLGDWEWLARPAEWLAMQRAGKLARFDPARVSPLMAAGRVHTRMALLAGDADTITPLPGVRGIAATHPDLTVVHGATHMFAGAMYPGGYRAWALQHLRTWGFASR
jgi:hypothetical protein